MLHDFGYKGPFIYDQLVQAKSGFYTNACGTITACRAGNSHPDEKDRHEYYYRLRLDSTFLSDWISERNLVLVEKKQDNDIADYAHSN